MEPFIICRCEEVSLEEITKAAHDFSSSAREIKLRTRAGMGFCGGRTCRHAIEAIIRNVYGKPEDQELPLKVQPPVRPVTLSTLGSRVEEDE